METMEFTSLGSHLRPPSVTSSCRAATASNYTVLELPASLRLRPNPPPRSVSWLGWPRSSAAVESHPLFHQPHRGFGDRRNSLGAFAEHPVQVTGLGHNVVITLLQRLQARGHHFGYLLFQVAVTHAVEMLAHLFSRPAAEGLE